MAFNKYFIMLCYLSAATLSDCELSPSVDTTMTSTHVLSSASYIPDIAKPANTVSVSSSPSQHSRSLTPKQRLSMRHNDNMKNLSGVYLLRHSSYCRLIV